MIWTKAYWCAAAGEFRSVRSLVVAGLMTALSIVISGIYIPVAENLRLMFTFVPMGIAGMVCGPLVGMVVGLVSDLVGIVVHPSGPFFPGYTLSAILGALVYSLAFYRQRPTVWRVLLARGIVNLFVNAGLGSVWSAMLMGKAYAYYFGVSIVKNLAMLPIEAIIMLEVFRIILPYMERMNMVALPPRPQRKTSLLRRSPN